MSPVQPNSSAVRFGARSGSCLVGVPTVTEARRIAQDWITNNLKCRSSELGTGLPEVDDRYGAWQVPLLSLLSRKAVGNLRISCEDGSIQSATLPITIKLRLNDNLDEHEAVTLCSPTVLLPPDGLLTPDGQGLCYGDSRCVLAAYRGETLDLVITSPPYFNARPEYSEYANYEEYLALLASVFSQCHRLLREGRFMIVNASPVLIRRAARSQSSQRIPVPFHINTIMERLGFDFVDDIIWLKPEGAGWATGRGRRFAADRQPLQYKPVPVTEYFLIYRKHTDRLIDWNISNADQQAVQESLITGEYEVTNVWRNSPATNHTHPAVFPDAIIRKLIKYYSFRHDIVLDPFAGSGTVGKAALAEGRGYLLVDNKYDYWQLMVSSLLPKEKETQ